MNFTLDPEIEAVRDMVSRFMANEVVPVMEEYEKRQEFPRELIRKAGRIQSGCGTLPSDLFVRQHGIAPADSQLLA